MEQDTESEVAIEQLVEVTCKTEPVSSAQISQIPQVLEEIVQSIQAQQDIPPMEITSYSVEILQESLDGNHVPLQVTPTQAKRVKNAKSGKPCKRDKPKLLDGLGYTYNVKRVRGVATDWQCTVRSKALTCRATVKQQGGAFTPGPQPHLHLVDQGIDLMKCEFRKSNKKLKISAKMTKAMKGQKHSRKSKDAKLSKSFYFSNYGKPRLVEKRSGYTYEMKKDRGDSTDWQCTLRSKEFKCPATFKQKKGEFISGPKPHCHEGDINFNTASNVPSRITKKKKKKESIAEQAWGIVNAEETLPNPSTDSPDHELSEEALAAGFRIIQSSSVRSRPRLIDSQGFTYNVKRRRGKITDWQCTIRNKTVRCMASFTESNGKLTPGSHSHVHAPEPGAGIKTIVTAKIRAQALANLFKPTSEIVDEVLMQEVSEKPTAALLKPDNLVRMAYRARQVTRAKFVKSMLYGIAGFKPQDANHNVEDSDSDDESESDDGEQ